MSLATRPRVGMVGAGQLARMSLAAATALDVELAVLAADPSEPAAAAGARTVLGAPDDLDALRALAARSDVVTFDHEVIPPGHLRALAAEGHRLRPPPGANLLAQDKLRQRAVLGDELGLPVPAHAVVRSAGDVEAFAAVHGWPVVAKRPRGGYDGRGVWVLDGSAAAGPVLAEAAARGEPLLLERHVELRGELAVLVARRPGGEAAAYPVVQTVQREGMLRELVVPAPVVPERAAAATALARRVAEAIDAVGILAVELLEAGDGELLVNELALRPHNSGHWTIEGAATSQFEQHLRAVLDLPLGSPAALAPAAATVNVVGSRDGGDPRARRAWALAVPDAHVHLYGKAPRPGRKLGHVTVLGAEAPAALARAREAAAALQGEAA